MLIKTKGIVLKSIKYSETSVISTVYTEELGLQKYLINGVRSSKAKIRMSLLQPMSLVEMIVYKRENRDLNKVSEIRAAQVFSLIPFELTRGSIGLFMTELLQKTLKEAEPNTVLFDFLYHSFLLLDQTPIGLANVHLLFMSKLTFFLGFLPDGDSFDSNSAPCFYLREGRFVNDNYSHTDLISAEDSQLLYDLFITDWANLGDLQLNGQQRRRMLNHLLAYYRCHLDDFGEMNSPAILQSILA